MSKTITSILDGDNRRRVMLNGKTIGWVTKWYERDRLNGTGIPRFSAKPIGLSVPRHSCETYSSAVAYILGYHGVEGELSPEKKP